jgi:hypothetical protein
MFWHSCNKFTMLLFLFWNASKNGLNFENEMNFKNGTDLKNGLNFENG